ncbi:MAG: flagellar biosynthesis protein FlhF [Magnetococcales bacterium]|nr:flagellar biosynthesis protein FlhF [Magnetococcales bacterium]
MKISTFKARDMREVLKEVKEKLGADAVILSTRSVREPGGGLTLGRTLIEVTACPGPNAPKTASETGSGGGASDGRTRPQAQPLPAAPPGDRQREAGSAKPWSNSPQTPGRFSRVVDDAVEYPPVAQPRPERGKPVAPEEPPPASRPAMPGPDAAADADEAQEPMDGCGPRLDAELAHDKPFDTLGELTGLDAESKRNYSWLLMHGVEEPIARRIVLMDRSGKERGLAVAFQRALKFRDPLAGSARVIALVGPTGVGKTTTLAKIAADLILNRQRSVGMITLDTFRVGAVAQLETYAKLLQVRLVVARAPSEVKAGLHSLNRCDYVLVDTVGSSPYNRRQVNSTASLLPDVGEDREVILCMAANVRETEQQAIYRRFAVLKPTGLIFTKLDETVTYGGILNVCIKADLPLTLYTDGQRVPENLGWMSAKTLSKWFARDTQAEG